jgi:hypothetical protein
MKAIICISINAWCRAHQITVQVLGYLSVMPWKALRSLVADVHSAESVGGLV